LKNIFFHRKSKKAKLTVNYNSKCNKVDMAIAKVKSMNEERASLKKKLKGASDFQLTLQCNVGESSPITATTATTATTPTTPTPTLEERNGFRKTENALVALEKKLGNEKLTLKQMQMDKSKTHNELMQLGRTETKMTKALTVLNERLQKIARFRPNPFCSFSHKGLVFWWFDSYIGLEPTFKGSPFLLPWTGQIFVEDTVSNTWSYIEDPVKVSFHVTV
jgi:hypothetical protein